MVSLSVLWASLTDERQLVLRHVNVFWSYWCGAWIERTASWSTSSRLTSPRLTSSRTSLREIAKVLLMTILWSNASLGFFRDVCEASYHDLDVITIRFLIAKVHLYDSKLRKGSFDFCAKLREYSFWGRGLFFLLFLLVSKQFRGFFLGGHNGYKTGLKQVR